MDRFREIGSLSFKDLGGSEHPYLSKDELAQLCVAEGTLTPAEWEDMMSHVRRSQEYLDEIPWTSSLVKIPAIAGAHHEKLDGSGYPDRLTAEQILPQTRILTICDMFDAMTAVDRPYRKAVDIQTAVQFLRQDAGRGLIDADLVELFREKVLPALVGSDDVETVDTGDNALASGQYQLGNNGAKGD